MSEERLQEIKDSISLQYKVQEANDLNNFNIFTDEEQELVNEIEKLKLELSGYRQAILQDKEMLGLKQENERLHSIIKEVREYIKDNVVVYAFNNKDLPHWEFNDDNVKELLEILDKGKE